MDLLTFTEAAAFAGVSTKTIHKHVKQGKLAFVETPLGKRIEKKNLQPYRDLLGTPGSEHDAPVESSREPIVENQREDSAPVTTGQEQGQAGMNVPLQAHLAALALARAQIERLAHQVEESQRMMLIAERARMAIEAQTQHQVAQYQRILSEHAESLAEERALRMSLELQRETTRPTVNSLDQAPPIVDTPTKRRGWRQRVKRWLFGEKAAGE